MSPVVADPTSLSLRTKMRVKDAMLDRARTELRAQVDSANTERDAGQLDQDTSLEVDDISQADEAGDLVASCQRYLGEPHPHPAGDSRDR